MQSAEKIVPIGVEFDLRQIPKTKTCSLCDGPTTRALLRFTSPFNDSGQLTVAYCDIPGYECHRCGVASFDTASSVKALQATVRITSASGDHEASRLLQASIDAGQQQIARFSSKR